MVLSQHFPWAHKVELHLALSMFYRFNIDGSEHMAIDEWNTRKTSKHTLSFLREIHHLFHIHAFFSSGAETSLLLYIYVTKNKLEIWIYRTFYNHFCCSHKQNSPISAEKIGDDNKAKGRCAPSIHCIYLLGLRF